MTARPPENGQLFRYVVGNVPVIVFAVDRDGTFLLSESQGLEALGVKPGENVGKSVVESRRVIEGLRPPLLDKLGAVAAIEYLVGNAGAEEPSIHFTADVNFRRLESLLEVTIYRVVQEAITNIKRHSRSYRAEIRLTEVDDRIRIEIRDWGVGFDPDSVSENRFGLQGIRERARLLHGRAVIDSAPGEGTRIFVDLPLAHALEEVDSLNSWSI